MMLISHLSFHIAHCRVAALSAGAEIAEQFLGNGGIAVQPIVKVTRLCQLLVCKEGYLAAEFLCHHKIVRHDDDGCLEQRTHVVDKR